jgi:predicted RNA-binding protein YlqC (UPF0109 family)
MSSLEEITETIRASLKLMVDDPEYVEVECLQIAGGACLCIEVASTDRGKIIGKQGRNAKALRVLASAMGMTLKQRITLDIQE